MASSYLATTILIENRFGTGDKTGKFLVSSYSDLIELARHLDRAKLKLGIVLDLPQLISQLGDMPKLDKILLHNMFSALSPIRHRIKALHLWGKRRGPNGRFAVPVGNLNTYFEGKEALKEIFLEGLLQLFNDDIPRYFVPEVNSGNQDVESIINRVIQLTPPAAAYCVQACLLQYFCRGWGRVPSLAVAAAKTTYLLRQMCAC